MAEPPSNSQDKFIVRLPDGMRERIKVVADENRRSMNAEIVAALEEKFPSPTPLTAHEALVSVFDSMSEKDLRKFAIQYFEEQGLSEEEVDDLYGLRIKREKEGRRDER